jgi:hypothetical protein
MFCPLFSVPLLRFVCRLSSAVFRLPSFVLRLTPIAYRLSFLVFFSVSISVAVSLLGGCGRKTLVRPPELVMPEPVNDLTLEVQEKGVTLRWGRTQKTAAGEDLDDLAGFVVLRAAQNPQGQDSEFSQVATIPVEDRDRFRKNKKFSYTDEQLTVGALYRYRVLAFTLDGYYGGTSNTVELVWKESLK